MTQKQMLMRHFKTNEWIDPQQAQQLYSIGRLAARAHEMGLIATPIEKKNQFGETYKTVKYRLPAKG